MTFRRGGWALVPWYLYVVLGWCFAALFVLAFVVAVRLPDKWGFERTLTTVLIGVLVYPCIRMAVGGLRWIADFRRHYLILDEDGVRFRLPGTDDVYLTWSDIESVTTERLWLTMRGPWPFGHRADVFTVAARSARYRFTNMEIPRARLAAEEIRRRIPRVA